MRKEQKRLSKSDIFSRGLLIGSGSLLAFAAFAILVPDPTPALWNSTLYNVEFWGSLAVSASPFFFSLGTIAAAMLTKDEYKPISSNVTKATLLLGGSAIGALTTTVELIGGIGNINYNDTSASLWLGAVPLTAGPSYFAFQKAKQLLRR